MICNLGVVGSNPTRGSKEGRERRTRLGPFLLFMDFSLSCRDLSDHHFLAVVDVDALPGGAL